jgi:hypothetical protein
MLESNQSWLYLWTKQIVLEDNAIVTRICFGITSNYINRAIKYEGSNGHKVVFCDLWAGPSRVIKTLESRIKTVFDDYLVIGSRSTKYEWLVEDITLEQIKGWINYEIESEFPSIQKFEEVA